MAKKLAVLVKENAAEGMRMAVGLTLADDELNVFVLDKKLPEDDPDLTLNVETLTDFDIKVFTNAKENSSFEFMSTEQIAGALANYDAVIAY